MRWQHFPIKDFGQVITGKTPPTSSPELFGADYPFITPTDIDGIERKITANRFLSNEGKEYQSSLILPPKTVCVVCIGATIGKLCLTDRESFTNQQINSVIVDDSNHDPHFLYYALKLKSPDLIQIASGAAMQIINKSDFSEVMILAPPLPIQRCIADVLGRYDDLIENYQRQIGLLEAMARELYREWFVRGRCPYAQIQMGGAKTKLKRFVEMNFGQSPSSEFYNENGDGLPFHQGVGTYGTRFPRHEVFCSIDGRISGEGDILFSVRAPVGRLNIADRKMIIGRGLASLRHKQGFNSFLFYLFQDTFSKEDIIGNGAIFASVSRNELEEFEVQYPDENLVERFDNLATCIGRKILILNKETQLLRQMRDKLLSRLMSGQLEVTGQTTL